MNAAAAHAENSEKDRSSEREDADRERDWNWETENARRRRRFGVIWRSRPSNLQQTVIWGGRAGRQTDLGQTGGQTAFGVDGFGGVVQSGWTCGDFGRTGCGADEIWGWLGTDGRDLRRIRGSHAGTSAASSSSGGHVPVRADVQWFWAD